MAQPGVGVRGRSPRTPRRRARLRRDEGASQLRHPAPVFVFPTRADMRGVALQNGNTVLHSKTGVLPKHALPPRLPGIGAASSARLQREEQAVPCPSAPRAHSLSARVFAVRSSSPRRHRGRDSASARATGKFVGVSRSRALNSSLAAHLGAQNAAPGPAAVASRE